MGSGSSCLQNVNVPERAPSTVAHDGHASVPLLESPSTASFRSVFKDNPVARTDEIRDGYRINRGE